MFVDEQDDNRDKEEETCGICLLEFEELEMIKKLNCSEKEVRHLFHFECIY